MSCADSNHRGYPPHKCGTNQATVRTSRERDIANALVNALDALERYRAAYGGIETSKRRDELAEAIEHAIVYLANY